MQLGSALFLPWDSMVSYARWALLAGAAAAAGSKARMLACSCTGAAWVASYRYLAISGLAAK